MRGVFFRDMGERVFGSVMANYVGDCVSVNYFVVNYIPLSDFDVAVQ